MRQVINEAVSIYLVSKVIENKYLVMPLWMSWRGEIYKFTKMGRSYKEPSGRYFNHIFTVSTDAMDFKLMLDITSLHWILVEVTDGSAN